jgi:hypothetical protein
MQVTHPDLFGDLGNQTLPADRRLGIRQYSELDGSRGSGQVTAEPLNSPDPKYERQ